MTESEDEGFTPFLGKREPIDRPAVEVRNFLRLSEEIPEHPPTNPAPTWRYPMDFNDRAGVCVVASCDHTLQTIANQLGVARANWTEAQILSFYQTQNPDFHDWSQGGTDADGGMYVQVFLEELVKQGQILAFGKIDHTNDELIKAAVFIGLGIVTGSALQVAQQRQIVWDYVPNSPAWGGHAVCLNGYELTDVSCVTWAQRKDMSPTFVDNCMDEAWLVLTPAMIESPQFRNHFNLEGFSEAIHDLTEGKVVVPVPDVPNVEVPFPRAQLDYWAGRWRLFDPKYEREAKAAYKHWRESHTF